MAIILQIIDCMNTECVWFTIDKYLDKDKSIYFVFILIWYLIR